MIEVVVVVVVCCVLFVVVVCLFLVFGWRGLLLVYVFCRSFLGSWLCFVGCRLLGVVGCWVLVGGTWLLGVVCRFLLVLSRYCV